jgi:hypothetical protein
MLELLAGRRRYESIDEALEVIEFHVDIAVKQECFNRFQEVYADLRTLHKRKADYTPEHRARIHEITVQLLNVFGRGK